MNEVAKLKAQTLICDKRFTLRSIEECDIDILRIWKNYHKNSFFFKKDISPQDQVSWFRAFCERKDDHMFVILDGKTYVGCLGARLLGDYVDFYNIILGDKSYKGSHVMTNALWALASFSSMIYKGKPIHISVLITNSAITWYEKIGFFHTKSETDHVIMQLDCSKIQHNYIFEMNNPIQTI